MLRSAAEHHRVQAHIAAQAVAASARASTLPQMTALVAAYQAAAVEEAELAVALMLAEQAIDAAPVGAVQVAAIAGTASSGLSLQALLGLAQSASQRSMIVLTQVLDAGRVGGGVALASRPNVTGYVRYLSPPSCARCAILAGRFYRWSDGFLRHPNCDCVMLPTDKAPSADLVTSPKQAFEQGQIHGLSKADTQAIVDGADMGRVVNVRAKAAGLHTAGGAVLTRRTGRTSKPTPEQIYRVASTREQAIELLRQAGYIT